MTSENSLRKKNKHLTKLLSDKEIVISGLHNMIDSLSTRNAELQSTLNLFTEDRNKLYNEVLELRKEMNEVNQGKEKDSNEKNEMKEVNLNETNEEKKEKKSYISMLLNYLL